MATRLLERLAGIFPISPEMPPHSGVPSAKTLLVGHCDVVVRLVP